MNAKIRLMAATALACVAGVHAQRMELNQVPSAVRTRIEASRELGSPRNIVRHVQDGKTVYEVEFEKNNAPNPRVRYAEDGTVINEMAAVGSMEEGWIRTSGFADGTQAIRSALRIGDLPERVQATAKREAGGREIVDVDREQWDNRTVYEIEFGEPGRNPQIHVAEDGAVVRDERPREGLKSLFLGTQVRDTPPAVQETIRRLTEDREIVDIDRRGTRERPIYRVMARRNGVSYEVLHITEDGKVVSGIPPARG